LKEVEAQEDINTVDFLVYANQKVYGHLDYNIRMEPGVQTCEDTLTIKSGSCRDSAWLLVQILRHKGILLDLYPGYLVQLTPDITWTQLLLEEDFTDLHAWVDISQVQDGLD
jgi:transglutaminase-like putative cysteine protease